MRPERPAAAARGLGDGRAWDYSEICATYGHCARQRVRFWSVGRYDLGLAPIEPYRGARSYCVSRSSGVRLRRSFMREVGPALGGRATKPLVASGRRPVAGRRHQSRRTHSIRRHTDRHFCPCALRRNAAEMKEESGSVTPAHYIIRSQFRAAEFRIEIANGMNRKIESRDWGGLEGDNGTKNVIDRGIKIRIMIVTGTRIRREQNLRTGLGPKAESELEPT
ncbi:hypothetical protein EVAR_80002_1 [Eumeta japonica]|uniref:Uncharacterized protein n=1 Tax=Eumeta variegata TaxID=151549 RepID=A0A4C1WKE6_EUMVA|nr:hypothetical protein EVAR_80002_1 [Eumeta japonica]